jgi:hypothetical protein
MSSFTKQVLEEKYIEVTTVEKWNTKLKEWEDEVSAKFVLFPRKK